MNDSLILGAVSYAAGPIDHDQQFVLWTVVTRNRPVASSRPNGPSAARVFTQNSSSGGEILQARAAGLSFADVTRNWNWFFVRAAAAARGQSSECQDAQPTASEGKRPRQSGRGRDWDDDGGVQLTDASCCFCSTPPPERDSAPLVVIYFPESARRHLARTRQMGRLNWRSRDEY